MTPLEKIVEGWLQLRPTEFLALKPTVDLLEDVAAAIMSCCMRGRAFDVPCYCFEQYPSFEYEQAWAKSVNDAATKFRLDYLERNKE